MGFALEDFSALHFMREQASRLGLLAPLDLIPSLQDPKDLFALIGSESAAIHAAIHARNPRPQSTQHARLAERQAEVLVQ